MKDIQKIADYLIAHPQEEIEDALKALSIQRCSSDYEIHEKLIPLGLDVCNACEGWAKLEASTMEDGFYYCESCCTI